MSNSRHIYHEALACIDTYRLYFDYVVDYSTGNRTHLIALESVVYITEVETQVLNSKYRFSEEKIAVIICLFLYYKTDPV